MKYKPGERVVKKEGPRAGDLATVLGASPFRDLVVIEFNDGREHESVSAALLDYAKSCATCVGYGFIVCPECDGYGSVKDPEDPFASHLCPTCGDRCGTLICPDCEGSTFRKDQL